MYYSSFANGHPVLCLWKLESVATAAWIEEWKSAEFFTMGTDLGEEHFVYL